MGSNYVRTRPESIFDVRSIVTIHYHEFGPEYRFTGEQHDFWEMVYIDKGRVEIQRDADILILKQGEILFHEPNEFHTIRSLDSAPNVVVISFNCPSAAMGHFVKFRTLLNDTLKTYLSSIMKEAEKTYGVRGTNPELRRLKRQKNAPVGGEQLIKTYLEQFLIFLLRSVEKETASTFPQRDGREDPLVSMMKAYIEEHLEENVRIQDLCREFDYSRSYLCRRFMQKTGQSLMEYSTRRKIKEAKRLIRETGMNFAQVSAQLAFENPQYFSRVFKRVTGMTPSEFKKRAHIR